MNFFAEYSRLKIIVGLNQIYVWVNFILIPNFILLKLLKVILLQHIDNYNNNDLLNLSIFHHHLILLKLSENRTNKSNTGC